jgi:hypothetical protein
VFAFIWVAVVTSLAGSGNRGFADGAGTQASFNFPYGVAVDTSGTVFVADVDNQRIRKVSPTGGALGCCEKERSCVCVCVCLDVRVCVYVCVLRSTGSQWLHRWLAVGIEDLRTI